MFVVGRELIKEFTNRCEMQKEGVVGLLVEIFFFVYFLFFE
jgi:hypothetical protein